MDAIVTAGGIPQPDEPLYPYTQGISKAMLDIQGKPMVQWVLDALCEADSIEHIVIVGLSEDSGLKCNKIGGYLPNQGGMIGNIKAGVARIVEINPKSEFVLIASSDIPTITAEMVNWVVNKALETNDDVYYNVITRQVMEARFPGSNRTYTHLREGDVCGSDMNVIRSSLSGNDELWQKIVASRKNVLRQAALIGYGTLILMLLRQLDMDSAVKRVAKKLNITGRAIVSPYAEIGMDVDKPHQLEIVRADLARRAAQGS
jgi:CTP:molybdopterin cytidylyltransferase MocA